MWGTQFHRPTIWRWFVDVCSSHQHAATCAMVKLHRVWFPIEEDDHPTIVARISIPIFNGFLSWNGWPQTTKTCRDLTVAHGDHLAFRLHRLRCRSCWVQLEHGWMALVSWSGGVWAGSGVRTAMGRIQHGDFQLVMGVPLHHPFRSMEFSFLNHPVWVPPFMETHVHTWSYMYIIISIDYCLILYVDIFQYQLSKVQHPQKCGFP